MFKYSAMIGVLALFPACHPVGEITPDETGQLSQAYTIDPRPHLSPLKVEATMNIGPAAAHKSKAFGKAVAASGDVVVVGVPNAGDGAALVYTRTGSTWTSTALTVPSPGLTTGATFGAAVAISEDGNAVAVGAPLGKCSVLLGCVYLFQRNGAVWDMVKTLTPSMSDGSGTYGAAVGITRDPSGLLRVAVGDPKFDQNNGVADTGIVWVFGQGASWHSPWLITSSVPGVSLKAGELFGHTVDISGDTLVVGAPGKSSSGRAYLYERDATGNWDLARTLAGTPGTGKNEFGHAVALDATGTTAVVGEPGAEAAHVFERLDSSWAAPINKTLLKGAAHDLANVSAGDRFGHAVAIGTNVLYRQTVAVGAPQYTVSPGAQKQGALYLFVRPADSWVGRILTEDLFLSPGTGYTPDNLGASVALGSAPPASEWAVIGAPGWHGAVHVRELNINRRSRLVNYWSFDSAGEADAVSGLPIFTSPGANWTTGSGCKSGGCYHLNGAAHIVAPSDIPMFSEERSIMMWFKDDRPASTTGKIDAALFSYGLPNVCEPRCPPKGHEVPDWCKTCKTWDKRLSMFTMVVDNDELRFSSNECATKTHTDLAGSITPRALHHAAVTYKPNLLRPYLDGKLGVKGGVDLNTNPHADLLLGVSPAHNRTFTGYLDEVKIYDTPLSMRAVKLIASH